LHSQLVRSSSAATEMVAADLAAEVEVEVEVEAVDPRRPLA
jgi:hypothetical protein